jgi:hypothetical protein
MQVMLDRDIAKFYSVKTIKLREQVKRNIKRFPSDFMFQLTEIEADFMVSQNAIPSKRHLKKEGSGHNIYIYFYRKILRTFFLKMKLLYYSFFVNKDAFVNLFLFREGKMVA